MYRIGIDLGGTNIAAAVVDNNFNIIIKKSIPTVISEGGDRIVNDMAFLCRWLCAESGISEADIEAVGIASPGIANSRDGVVEYACNLPLRKYPICKNLSDQIGGMPVHVENDANAAAWGEAVAGAAKGTSNSVMITLGTGVGGGVIIDGKVYSGFNFAGSELGHIVISAGGRPCGCGRRGCWEAYSSATALINMTKEKLSECRAQNRETLMFSLSENGVNGKVAFDAYDGGDAAAREVIEEYAYYLACGITNIINLYQPEVLSIGGGISGQGEKLLDMIMPIVKAESYGGDGTVIPTKVCIAELGNDAGIIGAAFLGI
ncbi:MAG: ROK family protein [Ruminococcaceae bacterium]|nr:ROK family protein [Oscillospiraceae bacterium]